MAKHAGFISLVILLFIIPPLAGSNGLDHILIEKGSGKYLFEVATESKVVVEKELTGISIAVHDVQTKEPVEARLWVRIADAETIHFTTTQLVLGQKGPAFFSFRFPEKGTYQIDVAVAEEGRNVGIQFPLEVKGRESGSPLFIPLLLLAGGFVIGAAAHYFSSTTTTRI